MSYIYPIYKHGTEKFKLFFLYNQQKIYLGTFDSEVEAKTILKEAEKLISEPKGLPSFNDYQLSYKKIIPLCNLRDNGTYIKNPIYVYSKYFLYYLDKNTYLTFDLKDLFYFSTYKIYKRGGYLYTQDSVSQQNILSRFGVKNHAVSGKDYYFKNNNPYDLRRENLTIINNYRGVTKIKRKNEILYSASIYTTKNIIIGHYSSEIEAAIAYNKAVDLLITQGETKNFIPNTIPFLTLAEYRTIYDKITISHHLLNPSCPRKRVISTKTYRGIYQTKNSFKATIGYKGKQLYLGMYATEKRAAQAYNFASFYLFGSSGYVNAVNPLIEDKDSLKIAAYLAHYGITKNKEDASS